MRQLCNEWTLINLENGCSPEFYTKATNYIGPCDLENMVKITDVYFYVVLFGSKDIAIDFGKNLLIG